MMDDFEIFIGTHSAAAVVFFLADNMDFFYIKGIRSADNRSDVEIVFNVFNRDFKGSTGFFEHGKNLFVCHSLILINQISSILHGLNYNMDLIAI